MTCVIQSLFTYTDCSRTEWDTPVHTTEDVVEGTSLLGDLIIIIKVDTFHRSCYVANAILILAGLSSHPSSRSFADLQECEGDSRSFVGDDMWS